MSSFSVWHWIIVVAILFFVLRPIFRGFSSGVHSSPTRSAPPSGSRSFTTAVVGESKYQANLLSLCGERTPGGVEKYLEAQLVLEDSNPYDPNAVRVDISNLTVGYLSREAAPVWRKSRHAANRFVCHAVVRGGWDRGGKDQGSFGVWLDLPT